MGEDKTISVQVRADLNLKSVSVEIDPEGVIEVEDAELPLEPHRRRDDLHVAQIRVRPLLEDQATLLTVHAGAQTAVAYVEVRPERVIEEIEIEPPDALQFERNSYRLAWTKKKQLLVIAPAEVVDAEGKELRVTSSDPGVVVRGHGATLEFDDEYDFYRAAVPIEARKLGAKATLRAQLGGAVAVCNVAVTRDEEGPNVVIKIVDKEAGNFRALVERNGNQQIIEIMGRHPGIKRYLGPAPFKGQDLPITKSIIAEIVADQAARMVMERKFQLTPSAEPLDAARFYAEHYRYLSHYVTRCHRALVADFDE